MKTTGVSGIPKFGILDFLGHPSQQYLIRIDWCFSLSWDPFNTFQDLTATRGPNEKLLTEIWGGTVTEPTKCILVHNPQKRGQQSPIGKDWCFSPSWNPLISFQNLTNTWRHFDKCFNLLCSDLQLDHLTFYLDYMCQNEIFSDLEKKISNANPGSPLSFSDPDMSSSDSFESLSQKLAYLDCETLKLRIWQRLWSPSKFSWFWEIGQVTKLMQKENLTNLVPRLQSFAVDHEAWEQFLGLAEKRGRTGQGTAADGNSGEFSSQTWPQPPPPCFLPVPSLFLPVSQRSTLFLLASPRSLQPSPFRVLKLTISMKRASATSL